MTLLYRPALTVAALVAGVILPAFAADPPSRSHAAGDVRSLESTHFEQDGDVKCLTSALETGDASKGPSTFILKAPPGCVVPWHFHTAQEQAIIISGEVRMEMDGHAAATLGAGGFAMMPSKAAHQFSCVGKEPCLLTVAFDRTYDIFWVKKK